MWFREYRDYKIDAPTTKNQIESGHGIYGCEMHEINGWGNSFQWPKKKKKRGLIATLIQHFISNDKEEIP